MDEQLYIRVPPVKSAYYGTRNTQSNGKQSTNRLHAQSCYARAPDRCVYLRLLNSPRKSQKHGANKKKREKLITPEAFVSLDSNIQSISGQIPYGIPNAWPTGKHL